MLLYILWIAEGTFRPDVRAALSRRILFVPLIGACFLLPSLLVATSAMHGVHELARMAWMYLIFLYVSVRVRTRRHVWAILGGLAVFATLEMVIVVLQAKTGGVLGLSFLGVPTELGERVTDTESLDFREGAKSLGGIAEYSSMVFTLMARRSMSGSPGLPSRFVPSADMMTRRRAPPRLTTTTMRRPSGETAAGSESGKSMPRTTSDA